MPAWNNAQIKCQCKRCGATFNVSPSKGKQRYCSRSCFYATRFGRFNLTTPCEQCGVAVKVTQWELAHRKHLFCSIACRCLFAKRVVVLNCGHCGMEFEKKSSQHKRCKNHFCSHKCSEAFHVGERHYGFIGGVNYGREWRGIAARIRQRDKVCQRCGKDPQTNGRELDVHHLTPFAVFGYERRMEAHTESNLIALCRPCHKLAEYEVEQAA